MLRPVLAVRNRETGKPLRETSLELHHIIHSFFIWLVIVLAMPNMFCLHVEGYMKQYTM